MGAYDVGDAVRVSTSTPFQDSAGTVFDPTTVTAKFTDPSGTTTTYVFGTDAELVQNSTGDYQFDVNVDAAGVWRYRIEGVTSSNNRGAAEGFFTAAASSF